MSIFDRLCLLITHSLLCALRKFQALSHYCLRAIKPLFLPLIGTRNSANVYREVACHWKSVRSEDKKKKKVWGSPWAASGFLPISSLFYEDVWGDSLRQQAAGVCRRALLSKISERTKWKNFMRAQPVILGFRVNPTFQLGSCESSVWGYGMQQAWRLYYTVSSMVPTPWTEINCQKTSSFLFPKEKKYNLQQNDSVVGRWKECH